MDAKLVPVVSQPTIAEHVDEHILRVAVQQVLHDECVEVMHSSISDVLW